MADIIQKIVFKRGTKAALEAKLIGNNKPLKGEPIAEINTDGSIKFKIGDGNKDYKDLPYVSGAEGPSEYIKSASLSDEGKVLTLVKQDGSLIVFNALADEALVRAAADTALSQRIEALEGRGRFLSTWDCTTGKPTTEPTTPLPYIYKSGDYYLVSKVATNKNASNYKPDGTQYTGTASTKIETEQVLVGNQYTFDGTKWTLMGSTKDVAWGQIIGDITDQEDLQEALALKSDKTYVDTELAKKQDILNEYLKTAAREGNKLTITKKDGTQETFEVTASTTGTATTEAKYITINGTEYKLAGSDSSKLTEVYINPNNNKQMVFKFADGTDLNCDLSSLFPNIVKDTSATSISYTLVDNEEKAYSANNISNLNIIIPSTIAQGFLNILNFKTAENTTWTVNNQSSVSLKYFYDGIQVDSLPTLLNNYYYSVGTIHNGLNICMYIRVNT